MWRKLFKIFGARVVVTVDFDGEIRYRFAQFTSGGIVVTQIANKVMLPLDGKCTLKPGVYIKEWYEI